MANDSQTEKKQNVDDYGVSTEYRDKQDTIEKVSLVVAMFFTVLGALKEFSDFINIPTIYLLVGTALITIAIVAFSLYYTIEANKEKEKSEKAKEAKEAKEQQETADMVSNINRLSNKMNNMVQNVAILSTNTNDTANDIQKIATETNRTTQQMNNVSNNMNDVLNHINDMTQKVNNSVQQTQNVVESLQEIQENNKQLKKELTKISNDNQALKQQLEQSINDANESRRKIDGLTKLVQEMKTKNKRDIMAEGIAGLDPDELQNLLRTTISNKNINNNIPLNNANKYNEIFQLLGTTKLFQRPQ